MDDSMAPARRDFLRHASLGAAALMGGATPLLAAAAPRPVQLPYGMDRHRFGVNYVPSKNWYYCYNNWRLDEIRADLGRVAEIGADHIRVMVVWPWFQPNAAQVSNLHLDRFDQLMQAARAVGLDVQPSVFTGWLSGLRFDPNFYHDAPFYTSEKWAAAQSLMLTALAGRMRAHPNFLGFDIGNEINCSWTTANTAEADAWMARVLGQMRALAPGKLHVNGVDNQPWFTGHTFSPQALAARQEMCALHCWPFWTGAGKRGGPLDKPYTQLSAAMTQLARSYARDTAKPVWIQEFGVCELEMPAADIPRWMDMSISAAVAQGAGWFTWWASHDVSRQFEFHPFEYGLGLIDSNNRIKPQGLAFRRIAERYRGQPVALAAVRADAPPAVLDNDATWAWLLAHMG